MTLLTRQKRHQTASAYGTLDFTAALAAREAALGLSTMPTPPVADVTPADDAPATQATTRADAPDYGRDAFGNAITAPRGWYGQYAVHSWRRDGRTVYVCGEPERHARAGHWRLDGRMERGQGWICATCHTLEAERYAEKKGR